MLEVLEMVLREAASGLRTDVDEDSTALAFATETFAFALANLVMQTLIFPLSSTQSSYSSLQHHSGKFMFQPRRSAE